MRKAGIAGLLGLAGANNSSGDDVKKLVRQHTQFSSSRRAAVAGGRGQRGAAAGARGRAIET